MHPQYPLPFAKMYAVLLRRQDNGVSSLAVKTRWNHVNTHLDQVFSREEPWDPFPHDTTKPVLYGSRGVPEVVKSCCWQTALRTSYYSHTLLYRGTPYFPVPHRTAWHFFAPHKLP